MMEENKINVIAFEYNKCIFKKIEFEKDVWTVECSAFSPDNFIKKIVINSRDTLDQETIDKVSNALLDYQYSTMFKDCMDEIKFALDDENIKVHRRNIDQ